MTEGGTGIDRSSSSDATRSLFQDIARKRRFAFLFLRRIDWWRVWEAFATGGTSLFRADTSNSPLPATPRGNELRMPYGPPNGGALEPSHRGFEPRRIPFTDYVDLIHERNRLSDLLTQAEQEIERLKAPCPRWLLCRDGCGYEAGLVKRLDACKGCVRCSTKV